MIKEYITNHEFVLALKILSSLASEMEEQIWKSCKK